MNLSVAGKYNAFGSVNLPDVAPTANLGFRPFVRPKRGRSLDPSSNDEWGLD